ncbi:hypothetical protein EHLJMEHL_00345 [Vreelandella titanicae]
MSRELNFTQAFWLGHLHYAATLQMPLSAYAKAQAVTLADLLPPVWSFGALPSAQRFARKLTTALEAAPSDLAF